MFQGMVTYTFIIVFVLGAFVLFIRRFKKMNFSKQDPNVEFLKAFNSIKQWYDLITGNEYDMIQDKLYLYQKKTEEFLNTSRLISIDLSQVGIEEIFDIELNIEDYDLSKSYEYTGINFNYLISEIEKEEIINKLDDEYLYNFSLYYYWLFLKGTYYKIRDYMDKNEINHYMKINNESEEIKKIVSDFEKQYETLTKYADLCKR